jgi:hypothetical protein
MFNWHRCFNGTVLQFEVVLVVTACNSDTCAVHAQRLLCLHPLLLLLLLLLLLPGCADPEDPAGQVPGSAGLQQGADRSGQGLPHTGEQLRQHSLSAAAYKRQTQP